MIHRVFFMFCVVFASSTMADTPISCILRPVNTLRIAPPVAGQIAAMYVDRGTLVEQGQILADLNTVVEQAQFRANQQRAESMATLTLRRTQLDDAERRLAHIETLFSRGVATQSQVDDLAAEVAIARNLYAEAEQAREILLIDLEAARAALDLRRIVAPVAGVVLARHLNVGEFAITDRPILDLVTVTSLHAEILLPDTAFGRFSVGDNLALRDERAQVLREGQVNAVDPVIDAGSRSFGIRVLLDNHDLALTAGMRCEIGE